MHCPDCGATLIQGPKLCPKCGAPVTHQLCPSCQNAVSQEAGYCMNCGYNLKGSARAGGEAGLKPPGIVSDLKGLASEEVVLKDTGHFPITYIQSLFSSINGKLHLTSHRLVFKASKLQGIGGTYLPVAGGIFIPNPADAKRSEEYFSIPLAEITGVESGWASLTVHASGRKYKFGGMLGAKKWVEAVKEALGK
ncbi:MAG: zinc ribbon domain-containing protein [Dehalococcoidia bacterium]|nr:zinc ribbon domain-containing protein [Dehalococcoidia bacterium]